MQSVRSRLVMGAALAAAMCGGMLPSTAVSASARTVVAQIDPAIPRSATSKVIVRGRDAEADVAGAVRDVGGTVTTDLAIVHGAAATVPAGGVAALARRAAVHSISLDRAMRVQASTATAATATTSVSSVYPTILGTTEMASKGMTGRGVTVAVIDTGIANVPDLAGRILPVTDALGRTSSCHNMSGEADCGDSFGHGTFMAGIIAGSGASSGGAWQGVAPGANLVSVKVAGRSGAADVSKVLAALQWVVSFRDRYKIKVLNLSLGTDSTQSYKVDPLNFAVERAWAAGITVVVAASNRGPSSRTISKPGDDPFVITVGAIDDHRTTTLADDRLPDFSSRGPTVDGLSKPDVAAPGTGLISLRAPGSFIDTTYPSSLHPSYRYGSGTSMATAAVSGTAALMLQAAPWMVPDRVKYAMWRTARRSASSDPQAIGAGVPNAFRATYIASVGLANAGLVRSNGLGPLDLSRGTVRVQADDPLATVVSGAMTAQLLVWDPVAYTKATWDSVTWYATPFAMGRWHGNRWHGSNWEGNRWHGASFYGSSEETPEYGRPAPGSIWYGVYR